MAEHTLKDEGILLGSKPEEMKCFPYFRRLIWCIGPFGFGKGIYVHGRPMPCDIEKINMSTCIKSRIAQPIEKQRYIDEAISKTKQIIEEDFDGAKPIFRRRTAAPAEFHDYQTITDRAEQMRLLEEAMGSTTHPHSASDDIHFSKTTEKL